MAYRAKHNPLRVLVFTTAMTGASLASETASAEQAIMLETIGAVRMAQPEEIRRRATEQDVGHQSFQPQTSRTEQDASAR